MDNTILRMNILGGMNEYIINNLPEEKIENWLIYGIPDGSTEEDFEEFAQDEEFFIYLSGLFYRLTSRAFEDEKEND